MPINDHVGSRTIVVMSALFAHVRPSSELSRVNTSLLSRQNTSKILSLDLSSTGDGLPVVVIVVSSTCSKILLSQGSKLLEDQTI